MYLLSYVSASLSSESPFQGTPLLSLRYPICVIPLICVTQSASPLSVPDLRNLFAVHRATCLAGENPAAEIGKTASGDNGRFKIDTFNFRDQPLLKSEGGNLAGDPCNLPGFLSLRVERICSRGGCKALTSYISTSNPWALNTAAMVAKP